MSTAATGPSHETFERTTSRWGSITLAIGLVIATSVPFYLLFTTDVVVSFSDVLTGFLAVFAVYGVFYVVEPLSYFPILGPAGMYQAFLIGNLSNKLIPAAIVAQNSVDVKPGTRKGEFTATMAICGAAVVHAVSMVLFVGILGSWLVSIVPDSVTEIARLYVLPAIMGGVTVQLTAALKQVRATVIALVVAALVIFVIVPLLPAAASGDVGIAVFATIGLTWITRDRNAGKTKASAPDNTDPSDSERT